MQMDKSLKLYRYISFQRFCEMLFHQELVFVHSDMWPDQYETFLARKLGDEKNKLIPDIYLYNSKLTSDKAYLMLKETVESFVDDMRFLCFSRSKDSEVMWNAYSFRNEAIMIRTSLHKVLALDPDKMCPFRIRYDQKTNGWEGVLNWCSFKDGGLIFKDVTEVFRHKRRCFQYENELRILTSAYDTKIGKREGKLLKYPIANLSDFVEKVMVHPLANDEYVALVESMCEHFQISFWGRSKIYEFRA